MALLFMDSFDHYASADLPDKYSAASGATIVAAAGRRSSSGLRTNGGSQTVSKALAVSGNVAILGIAMKMSALGGGSNSGYVQFLSAGTVQMMFTVNGSGFWQAYRRDLPFGTLLGTASGSPLVAGTYAFVEFRATIHASAGTVDIRINGINVLSLTAQNTSQSGAAAWDSIALFGGSSVDWDDLYVLDGSGSSPLNAFLGDCRVDPSYPTGPSADGAPHTQWTPSAGANWSCVDETAPNDDTDSVTASATGLKDTYAVTDAPVVGGTIYGVQLLWNIKKLDTGTCSVAPIVRGADNSSVVGDATGTAQNPTTTYAYQSQVYGQNPRTSAAWTEAGFNAAEFGLTRTA